MKTTIAGLLLLAATTTAQADPDDVPSPDNPVPPVPDPSKPEPDQVPPPIAEPVPVPQPQPAPIDTTPPPATNVVVNPPPTTIVAPRDWYSNAGFSLTLGGGVESFTGDTMRNTTDPGGDWTVRAAFGTNLPIGLEAAYIGSVQNINALGLDNSATLVGNGVQGDIRLNVTQNYAVQPFVYGGVAWRRYAVQNADFNTSDVRDRDDVLELPVGVGMAYKMSGFTFDARGEFRGSFYDNLVPDRTNTTSTNEGNAAMHRWGVNASVGYEF